MRCDGSKFPPAPAFCTNQILQASLDELGRLADPPLTKDAVAGRIRRLLAMADRRAEELNLPGTDSGVAADALPT